MVAELHKLGYEQLRICPRLSLSGVHWQCWLTASANVLQRHGAQISPALMVESFRSTDPVVAKSAFCTSANEDRLFAWNDAVNNDPNELAAKFIERFPAVISEAHVEDSDYVRWYRHMIDVSAPDGVPSTYISSPETSEILVDKLAILGESQNNSVPLPPPGRLVLRPEPPTSLLGRLWQRLGMTDQ